MPSRTLETGVGFYCMPSTYMRPAPFTEIYREAAKEAQLVEALGFDVFWTAEHHHAYDGYCPSALPAIAYLAAQTNKIKFGTGVYILPHHGAERTAEGAAAIQSMAPGRLRLAVGAGYWSDEFASQNLTLKDRGPLIEAALQGLVSEQTERFGETELWFGVNSPVALRRAGRYGSSLLLAAPSVETYRQNRAIWEAAFVPTAGRDAKVLAFFDIYVDEDPARVEWMRGRILEMWRNYALNWLDDPRAMGMEIDRSDDLDQQRFVRDTMATHTASLYLAGSASQIVDRLGPLVAAGVDGLAFRVRFDGVGGPMIERCVEELAMKVVPQLKGMVR